MSDNERDIFYMTRALELAKAAASRGEIPVGCVIALDDMPPSADAIVAEAYNLRETNKSASAHAELLAINSACSKLGGWHLHKCALYVTLEPCPMCAGAIVNARIKRVVYGAKDPKSGAFGSVLNLNSYPLNHKPSLTGGVLAPASLALLRQFFSAKR